MRPAHLLEKSIVNTYFNCMSTMNALTNESTVVRFFKF